ncbi:unnamed protein product [Symbiodinium microadriaticum]|nr:unnamed protein product [Symbiodinium microadriaticum]
MLASWACAVTLVFFLSVDGMLLMPFKFRMNVLGFQKDCPYAPWVYLAGVSAMLISFLAFPYCCPSSLSPKGFLDVVSIHQADPELMNRGVYGLGGFLRVSKEMRVLWSPPYLTRLWCVFELAAFRKANPTSPLRVKPLFVERQVLLLTLGTVIGSAIYFLARQSQSWRIGMYALPTIPMIFIVHTNRKCMREKHQLTEALETFQLKNAKCSLESDRAFVTSAIIAWYGSEDAFTAYVRGPLRLELQEAARADVPLSYGLLVAASPCTLALDVAAAMIQGGAPLDALISESVASGLGFALSSILLSVKITWWLCYRFASPGSTRLLDYLKTLTVFCVFWIIFGIGSFLSNYLEKTTLWGATAFGIVMFFLTVVAYAPPWRP